MTGAARPRRGRLFPSDWRSPRTTQPMRGGVGDIVICAAAWLLAFGTYGAMRSLGRRPTALDIEDYAGIAVAVVIEAGIFVRPSRGRNSRAIWCLALVVSTLTPRSGVDLSSGWRRHRARKVRLRPRRSN